MNTLGMIGISGLSAIVLAAYVYFVGRIAGKAAQQKKELEGSVDALRDREQINAEVDAKSAAERRAALDAWVRDGH